MRIAQDYWRGESAARVAIEHVATVTLTLAQRLRNRQRLTLDDGSSLGLALARGTVLRDGDVLVARHPGHDDLRVRVRAAHEPVLRVTPVSSPWQLARAAYHLGNRHVQLEIGEGYLQLEPDPVLVDMLASVGGVQVRQLKAPFNPDLGAYGGGHHHGHDETFAEDYALAQAAYRAHEPGARHEHSPKPADAATPDARPHPPTP
ncbi:MAG: urease accessory protein UreE [Pigmentiphaga sp.]|nr:urease accessory protein UreE [Pigmentiphaga sp.]